MKVADLFPQYRKAYNLRLELIEKGIVKDDIFTEDYVFDSISLCSSVILGRNSNGAEWKGARGQETKKGTIAFDIDDENTYESLSTGQLAYELIRNLLENGKIDAVEIEQLKGKNYTKSLFSESDYPVLANKREDHKGKGKTLRYRKKPVKYSGGEIFISTQWYKENREDLLNWYRRHL